ncbi:MAG: hypothetical protein ACR2NP_06810 [Pirellulaceae bacterium]
MLQTFLRQEDAPTFLEYGLLVIVIALVVVSAAVFFGTSVAQFFTDANNAVP